MPSLKATKDRQIRNGQIDGACDGDWLRTEQRSLKQQGLINECNTYEPTSEQMILILEFIKGP
jgi:hypothetical protein